MLPRRHKDTVSPRSSHLHWMRRGLTTPSHQTGLPPPPPPRRGITMAEVQGHNTEVNCWSVLHGRVYNLTSYLAAHPGGPAALLQAAGGDCTALFNEHHPWVNGHTILATCYVGDVETGATPGALLASTATPGVALHRTQWRPFPLLHKVTGGRDTVKLTFALPCATGLGVTGPGQSVQVRATVDGRTVERAYTPTSPWSQFKSFELMVKLYPDGVMSSYWKMLALGDTVEMRGPQGRIGYPEAGIVTVGGHLKQTNVRHLVMVAAGTGITPMLQLIRAVVENRTDTAKITLVDCNHSLVDIIARTQLEPLAHMFRERIKIHHVLHEAHVDDSQELGSFRTGKQLDKAMLCELLPEASPDVAVFHCGPPAFDEAVDAMLKDIGFKENQIFVF